MKNFALIPSLLLAITLIGAPLGAFAATASGSFDQTSLTTSTTKPTIEGSAENVKTVRITLADANGKSVYKSGTIKVKNGEWAKKIPKKLKEGNYAVTLYGSKISSSTALASSTLAVLGKGETGGSVSVSMIPLLFGGNALHGVSIPVAYVKVSNTGTASTSISGFNLTENGSAPDDVVIGFSTSDDKGASRTTIGGTEGSTQFKKGAAFVPLAGTIGPKQFRIYTIKAILSKNSGSYYGTKLMINVVSVATGAKVSGIMPLRGTTWTLVY